MKTRELTGSKLDTSEGLTGSGFGIRKEDVNFILSILRDGMYEDPIGSLCRELISNAVDAHTEAGIKDKPIKIYLPNIFESSIKFKDYGLGMSPTFIDENYRNFGASSKCYSDDQIGGLGIGSKSPWAYSDSFTVETIHKGIKYIYSCYLDENEVGQIFLLSQEKSDEPSGTMVTVPVQSKDYNIFAEKATYYSTYLPTTPEIHPKPNRPIKPDIFISGDDWECSLSNDRSIVVIGGIPYPINFSAINDRELRNHTLSNLKVIIYCKVGEVNISSSRESLKYTAKTESFLLKAFNKILKEGRDEYAKSLQSATSYHEAVKQHRKIPYSFDRVFFKNGSAYPTYRGKILYTSYKISSTSGEAITKGEYQLNTADRVYKSSSRWTSQDSILLDNNSIDAAYYINDVSTLTQSKYVAEILKDPGIKKVHIFKGTVKPLELSDLVFKQGGQVVTAEDLNVKLLSSVTLPVVTKAVSTAAQTPTVKKPRVKRPKDDVPVLKYVTSASCDRSAKGLYQWGEEGYVSLSQGGYYLPVDKGSAKTSSMDSISLITEAMGLLKITELYMVRAKQWEKFEQAPNWIDLENALNTELNNLLDKKILNYFYYSTGSNVSTKVDQHKKVLSSLSDDSFIKQFLNLHSEYHKAFVLLSNTYPSLWNRLICCMDRHDSTKYNELNELDEECRTRYPLLYDINSWSIPKSVIHYIQLVDEKYRLPKLKVA